MKLINADDHPMLEINVAKGTKIISLAKILFIKACDKGSEIHMVDDEIIRTRYLLNSFNEYLPVPFFFRCHNSYLINCSFVDCHTFYHAIMRDNTPIPLSRRKVRILKEILIELGKIS